MGPEAKWSRLPNLLQIAAVAVIAAGWGLFCFHVATVRELTILSARDSAVSRARVLREHAEQAFTVASNALRALDDQLDVPGIQVRNDPQANHLLLRRLRDSSSIFMGIGLVDRWGIISASADSNPPQRADLSDRDYFAAHRAEGRLGILIGAPVTSRPGNRLAIPVSRRLDDEVGAFDGVVAARLDPAYFEALYRSDADGVMLFRSDGARLAATLTDEHHVASSIASRAAGAREGALRVGQTDGRGERLIGYSYSEAFPIAVAVVLDEARLLAVWSRHRDVLAMTALASTGAILLLTAALIRRFQREAAMAAELRAARDDADAARISAEEANRAKSEFLAHMSHELRTPLNSIGGFSQLISSEIHGPVGDPRYAEYADIVGKSSEHLTAIIGNILDLAKVESGRWEVEAQPVALGEIGEELRTLTMGRADAHKVRLTIELSTGLPVVVTDRRLLLQILVNLTTNGVKFTPAGGSVSVTATSREDDLAIVVADTGCGMTQEDVARVLEPFGRGSSRLARKNHDTGLGLPLSRRFVELLGGRLEIDTAPDRGTRMTVHLPLVESGRSSGAALIRQSAA